MKSFCIAALLAGVATISLAQPLPANLASDPAKHRRDPQPQKIEGQPVETRPPEKADDKPLFPNQTRAPYRSSGVGYQITVLPIKLTRGGSFGFLPDGRILVGERAGTLRTLDAKGVVSDPITGLPAIKFRGGAGLAEVAVDPNFARTRRLYLSYDIDQGNDADAIAVARATLSPDGKSLTDVREIFRVEPALTNKQGNPDKSGRMAVAKDGTLFIALGARSQSPPNSRPQDLDNTLGKIVHITPDGKPAPGNPFLGKAGAKPEIWATGFRNPTGLVFDPGGRLWEIDMGPRGGDELNLVQRGKNYGWPVIAHGLDDNLKPLGEGLTAKAGMEQPRYYWDPVIAPSGLAFYDGNLFPQWRGSLLIGALRGERLVRLTLKGDRVVSEEVLMNEIGARLRDVRVGPDGAVYVLTDDEPYLVKLTPK